MRTVLAGIAIAGYLSCVTRGAADDSQPLQQADSLLQTGKYPEACAAFRAVLEADLLADGEQSRAVLGLSQANQQRGLWDAAAQVVQSQLEQTPGDADLQARLAELQFVRGDYVAAETSIQAALHLDEAHLLARLVNAHLDAERGEFDQALEGYQWFVRFYNREQPTDAESLLRVGAGALQYARWKGVSAIFDFTVNTLSVDALADEPHCWQARQMAGEVLLEKYNKAQALPEFEAALAINPNAAEVRVAQGRAALLDHDIEAAVDHAKGALAINPALPSALLLAADASISAGQLKSAMTFIEQSRKVNPIDQQMLARLAGVLLLDDGVPDRSEFDVILSSDPGKLRVSDDKPDSLSRFASVYQLVLTHHPRPGEFLCDLGEILDGHRKYEAAEVCFRRAIDVMPQLSRPRAALGLLAMRTGNLEEARSILDAAFNSDPYHVRVSNMRKVLQQLDGYATIDSEHFVIRVPQDEELLGEAMAEFLEQTYDELTELFKFEPQNRTQFEVYGPSPGTSAHQWFSARMVGLPWVQTIGASTGMIVAMASPSHAPQPFNWARVVRHEFVHILTLQQTRFNIPHWYTEALAVRTEGVTPAEWDALLMRRVPAGRFFTLKDINSGFQQPSEPDDWQMAYCQSWLYATYIAQEYGESAHARLLEAYRQNLSTDEAIHEACGVEVEQFEAGYLDFMTAYTNDLHNKRVEPPPTVESARANLRERPTERDAQDQLAWALWHADQQREAHGIAERLLEESPRQRYALAIVAASLLQNGEIQEAEDLLRTADDTASTQPEIVELLAKCKSAQREWNQARALWQTAVERWPREPRFLKGLAAVLLRQGDDEALPPVLKQLAELDADDSLSRKKLAALAHASEDWPAAIGWAREALQIDVTNASMHRILAEAYEATGQPDLAQREQSILSRLQH